MLILSVIIPMYNVEQYIKECLDSIFNQNFEDRYQIEVIVVDDGSTDNSYSIVNKYAKKYSNIILLKQKNSGQSMARNRAMSIAKGKYIFFCDSDDYIDRDSLLKLINICEKNKLDFLKTGWKTIYEEKNKFIENVPPNELISLKYELSINYFKRSISNWYNAVPWNGIYLREFLLLNKLFFPEGIQFEDNTFALKTFFANHSTQIMQISDTFYNARIRKGSITNEKTEIKKIEDQLKNINLMNEFIETHVKKSDKKFAKRAVASLTSTMIDYYFQLGTADRKIIRSKINLKIIVDGILYPQFKSTRIKFCLFLLSKTILEFILKRKSGKNYV